MPRRGRGETRLREAVVEGRGRSVHTGARARLSCRGDRATATLLVAVLLSLLTLTAACIHIHIHIHTCMCDQAQKLNMQV